MAKMNKLVKMGLAVQLLLQSGSNIDMATAIQFKHNDNYPLSDSELVQIKWDDKQTAAELNAYKNYNLERQDSKDHLLSEKKAAALAAEIIDEDENGGVPAKHSVLDEKELTPNSENAQTEEDVRQS